MRIKLRGLGVIDNTGRRDARVRPKSRKERPISRKPGKVKRSLKDMAIPEQLWLIFLYRRDHRLEIRLDRLIIKLVSETAARFDG